MEENFIIKDNTRIIAQNDDYYLATNDQSATLSDIYKLGAIINSYKEIISPELQIGVLTKNYGWNPIEAKISDIETIEKL